jgi:hypothetical protein
MTLDAVKPAKGEQQIFPLRRQSAPPPVEMTVCVGKAEETGDSRFLRSAQNNNFFG